MNHFYGVGQLLVRIVWFSVRTIVLPVARFFHLGVAWIAEDDEMILS